jgi:integrase
MPKVSKLSIRSYCHQNYRFAVWLPKNFRAAGDPQRRFFRTKREALKFVEGKSAEVFAHGKVPELSPEVRLAVAKGLAVLPAGHTVEMVFRHYLEGLAGVAPVGRTFQSVVTDFLALAKSRCEPVTFNGYYYRAKILCRMFGERDVNGITTRELDQYLTDKVGVRSRRHYKALLRSLFEFADVPRNPLAKSIYKRMRVPRREVPRVYRPTEMAAMLNKTLELVTTDPKRAERWKSMLWQLAIGGFAHVRPFECLRLDWRHIDLAHDEIRITEKIAKVKSAQRTIRIQPNLKAWLMLWPQAEGLIAGEFKNEKARYYFRTELLARLAGKPKAPADTPINIEWIHDGLRHSSASYHLKHFQKRDELIEELGHCDSTMLVEHYRNAMVSAEDAAAWYQVWPPAAAENKAAVNHE